MCTTIRKQRRTCAALLIAFLVGTLLYYHSYIDSESLIAMIRHDFDPPEKTSRLHYLIPASQPNLQLCFNLVSSAVNRYPVPILLGWHGVDEFDAARTHLAKLRAMQRYLDSLPPEENDDLAIIVDGYDVLIQLPPEIMVERYFQLVERADAHLAQRLRVSVRELHQSGLRQTIFMGPDKICWPTDYRAPRCWAAPESPFPPAAWGVDKGYGEVFHSDPRWLNSGSIMGPIGDLRKYIAATMDEIQTTYDPIYEFRESDQYYLSNVWGRQEYWRSKTMNMNIPAPPNGFLPLKSTPFQQTEYHVAIEYESALFQTKAWYEPYFGYLQFNEPNLTAKLAADIRGEGSAFEPPTIQMPDNVATSLGKLYDDIPEAHPGSTSADWLGAVRLGVNFVTHHIYGVWHCTGSKQFIQLEYPTMWFYPFAKSLLRAAVRASRAGEPLARNLVDGRRWVPKKGYPAAAEDVVDAGYGGVWTDLDDEFVPWEDVCQTYNGVLFRGEMEGGGA